MKKFLNIWKLDLTELYQMLLFMLAGGVFGIVFVKIIVSVDSTAEGYPVVGALIAMVIGLFFTVLADIFSFGSKFNLAVSMSCTRKEFFMMYWIENTSLIAIEIAAVLGFGFLETQIGRILYANTSLTEEFNALPYIMDFRIIAALVLLLPAIGMVFGACILKFQVKAVWAIWILWMSGFLGLGKISDRISQNPNSPFARILLGIPPFFKTVPVPALVGLFAAAAIFLFMVSFLLLRKQEVK